jgi:hypothetical protein
LKPPRGGRQTNQAKMNTLYEEAFAYMKHTWMEASDFASMTEEDVKSAMEPYDEFMESLVPSDTPFEQYIHRERMLYDLHDRDTIVVFRYDPRDESDSDSSTCYSESEYDDDSSEALSFINNVRIMDEGDFRDQLAANEFVGGYWDPAIHWVLSKDRLRLVMNH